MQIGFDATVLASAPRSAAARWTAGLLPALAAAAPGELRVYVDPAAAPPPGVPEEIVEVLGVGRLGGAARALRAELRARSPAVLISPTPEVGPLPGAATVATLLEAAPADLSARAVTTEWRRRRDWLARSLGQATAVIAASEVAAADAVMALGLSSAQVTVVPPGPTVSRATLDQVEAARDRHRLVRPHLVASVREPGDAFALAVAATMGARAVDYEGLTLLVSGPRAVTLQVERAHNLGDTRVAPAEPGELAALLGGAVACLVTSRLDGDGMDALDAMAAGCPCLLSDDGAHPEVAQVAALLLPPLTPSAWIEALNRVGTEPALRSALVERGVRRAARFRWEDAASAHLELCRRLG